MINGADGVRFSWFIPIDGDGSRAGTARAERPPDFEYLRRVVETAEELRLLLAAHTHPLRQRAVRRGCAAGGNLDHRDGSGGGHQPHPVF